MELKVKSLAGEAKGTVTLSDSVFGLEPRADILQRMVRWQLAKRQAGTHKSKTRGEIKATSKKMYRQKGTGSARHGNKAAPQFRGGGKAFGPVARSHAFDLPKKVRALALKHALSAKAKADAIVVVDDLTGEAKTKGLASQFAGLGVLERAHHRGQRDRPEFRPRRRQYSGHRRAADPGHQRLRHPAPRHAGPDQGRRPGAGGAVQWLRSSTSTTTRSSPR